MEGRHGQAAWEGAPRASLQGGTLRPWTLTGGGGGSLETRVSAWGRAGRAPGRPASETGDQRLALLWLDSGALGAELARTRSSWDGNCARQQSRVQTLKPGACTPAPPRELPDAPSGDPSDQPHARGMGPGTPLGSGREQGAPPTPHPDWVPRSSARAPGGHAPSAQRITLVAQRGCGLPGKWLFPLMLSLRSAQLRTQRQPSPQERPSVQGRSKAPAGRLAGGEVREDAVHLIPKGQAGAAHVPAPWLQGAIQELLGAGPGVRQEARLCPVQQAAPRCGLSRGRATPALQGPWRETRGVSTAGRYRGWHAGRVCVHRRPTPPACPPRLGALRSSETGPRLPALLGAQEDPQA